MQIQPDGWDNIEVERVYNHKRYKVVFDHGEITVVEGEK